MPNLFIFLILISLQPNVEVLRPLIIQTRNTAGSNCQSSNQELVESSWGVNTSSLWGKACKMLAEYIQD